MAKKQKKRKKAKNGDKPKRKIAITTKPKFLKKWNGTGAWIKTHLLPIFKMLKQKKMLATKENILNALNNKHASTSMVPGSKKQRARDKVKEKKQKILTWVIEEAVKPKHQSSKHGMQQVGK